MDLNALIKFFKDFGALIDVAIILGFVSYFFAMMKAKSEATIRQQKVIIDLLNERLKAQSEFTVEKATERFRSLKEYYEVYLSDWYDKSLEALNKEKARAIREKEREYEEKLSAEIAARTALKEKYEELLQKLAEDGDFSQGLSYEDFVGKYSLSGLNPGIFPGIFGNGYFGTLEISPNGDTLAVDWTIDSGQQTQTLHGTGILIKNVLSVVFKGPEMHVGNDFVGLVCYELLGQEVMKGIWTGLGEDSIGIENLRKIS